MELYKDKVVFDLPSIFITPIDFIIYINNLYKNNPNKFYNNVNIGCFYGSPGGIWNGERYVEGTQPRNILEKEAQMMKENNIPIRFTFSNCILKKEHLQDNYCNMLLDVFNTGINEIVCNSPILEEYIRKKYGNKYKYISSCTKLLEKKPLLKEINNKNYKFIELDIDYNKNFDFLEEVKRKDKTIMICNSTCKDNCSEKQKHFELISKMQLNYGSIEDDDINCKEEKNVLSKRIYHNNFITPDQINNIYLEKGFNHFEIDGRGASPSCLIEMILYYLIKDEYKLEVREELQQIFYL